MKKNNINEEYMYYSRVLNEPFTTVEELKEAEEAYYAKLKAKEDKAAQKKADATAVEEAYKALNEARKNYKDALNALTKEYSEALVNLKKTYEAGRVDIKTALANAEDAYANALKAFTEKYPEGYHITLKDGDFETTISSQTVTNKDSKPEYKQLSFFDIFDALFN